MNKIKEIFFKYKEQILYVLFGAFTTVVNIVTFAVCADMLHVGTYVSNLIAWILSVAFAYITNKIWVFESHTTDFKGVMREVISFVGARILTLGMDMVIMYIGIDIMHINQLITKILANIVVIVANYIFSKLFIFKKAD